MTRADVIVTFHTTHDALACERRLRETLPPVRLVATPRPISSECGFTLLCPARSIEEVTEALRRDALRRESIYRVRREGRRVDYILIHENPALVAAGPRGEQDDDVSETKGNRS